MTCDNGGAALLPLAFVAAVVQRRRAHQIRNALSKDPAMPIRPRSTPTLKIRMRNARKPRPA